MDSAFRTRTLTGLLFAVTVVLLIYFNNFTAGILLAIIAIMCSMEYGFIVRRGVRDTNFNGIMIAGVVPLAVTIAKPELIEDYIFILLLVSVVVMLVISFLALVLKIHQDHHQMGSIINIFYIGIPMAAISLLLVNGQHYYRDFLFGIFFCLWVTDTGAYIVGRSLGKHKLLERVSPGKTIEGSLGAGVFAVLFTFVLVKIFPRYEFSTWLAISLLTWIMGTWGDLFESSIKRKFDVKDSGTFLPGHGGFLDRFDSFLFAAPWVVVLLHYLDII